ncbi:MAG: membrane protein insertion efficiency factor YidD [Desulfuromonadaceae bacterium]|nr:membrane protein insertion efficiency factor YidD [Desulfuromonadaceae bacterium]MDD5104233.1 membrane protein insertion efficiency factor YidD [Desulfuromonadaceae bacterium]
MFKYCLLLVISFYQKMISPFLPRTCRFYPSCSEYSRESFIRHGVAKGFLLTFTRICKCHPYHPGGYDPVPK